MKYPTIAQKLVTVQMKSTPVRGLDRPRVIEWRCESDANIERMPAITRRVVRNVIPRIVAKFVTVGYWLRLFDILLTMIYYITGSPHKFEAAESHMKDHSINIRQKVLSIMEIQSESIKEIAIDKAKKAFAIVKKPLFVNDSGWSIPTLNGFPGAFMAYMNKWLTADDFIALMKGKKNRETILEQVIVYIDGKQIKVFEHKTIGKILTKASKVKGRPVEMVSSFSDGKTSETELRAKGIRAFEEEAELWHKLANWLKK